MDHLNNLYIANKLDELGLFKQADLITKKIVAQADYQRLYLGYRPLAILLKQKYNIDLFALPKNFSIMIKALKTGQNIPDFEESASILKALFQDPSILPDVQKFLQNYPQLSEDLNLVNGAFVKTMGKTLYEVFQSGLKDINFNEIKNTLQSASEDANIAKNLIQQGFKGVPEAQKGLSDAVNGLTTKTISEMNNATEEGYKLAPRIQKLIAQMEEFRQGYPSETVDVLKDINNVKDLQEKIQWFKNYDKISPKGKEFLEEFSKEISKLPENASIKNGILNIKSVEENAVPLKETIEKGVGVSRKLAATEESAEAAAKVAAEVPLLNKVMGPLGVLLSLPAMNGWIQKTRSGEKWWEDADQAADFVSDASNLLASVAMMIPYGQLLAGALGALSLAIQGGKWLIHHFVAPNVQDQLIAANTEEERQVILAKLPKSNDWNAIIPENFDPLHMRGLDQYQAKVNDFWVNELFSQVEPGNSEFNDYVKNKYPRAANQATGTEIYDITKVKMFDLLTDIENWIKTLPADEQKNYSWFTNPTEENKAMQERFKEKLNQFSRDEKAKKTGVVDNS